MTTETQLRTRDDSPAEKLDRRPTVAPAVDIFESKDELLIVADLPGIEKDDVTIDFDKGQLTILAHPRDLSADEEPFDYKRTFVVPQGIDAEKIAANLQNGVLRVSLPKPPALKPRQIQVRAG